MVKVGKYNYELSTAKGKKLMTVGPNGKIIHFGQKGYEHFFDKTKLLPESLNHKDPERKKSYRSRTAKITNKDGSLTATDPNSANYHARAVLW